MFHILGFIFLFILVILFIGLGIIATVVRKLFNLGSRTTTSNPNQKTWQGGFQQATDTQKEDTQRDLHTHKKKIFSDDEGEYVDFEEIKSEN